MLHLSGCCWNFFSRFIVAIPRTCAVHKVKYVVMCFGGMYFLLVRIAHFKVWRDQLYHRVQSNGTACSHTASVDDCFLFNLGMALEPFTAKIQRFIWSTSLPPGWELSRRSANGCLFWVTHVGRCSGVAAGEVMPQVPFSMRALFLSLQACRHHTTGVL